MHARVPGREHCSQGFDSCHVRKSSFLVDTVVRSEVYTCLIKFCQVKFVKRVLETVIFAGQSYTVTFFFKINHSKTVFVLNKAKWQCDRLT